MTELETPSPCINICVLDPHGYCLGCYRSIEEIAQWRSMSNAERAAVLQDLDERARRRELRA